MSLNQNKTTSDNGKDKQAGGGEEQTGGGEQTMHMKYEIDGWEDVNLDLKTKLLRGIFAYGYENPSAIQKKVLYPMTRYLKDGKKCDILAQAQSGTGKTGAFSISTLENIDESKKITQGLILAPTRELARQIHGVISEFSKFMNIEIKLLIGGTPVNEDKKSLEKNIPHIIVGTPGRVQDMVKRGFLKLENLVEFVIDEMDEMLAEGFKEQVYEIMGQLPDNIQVGLFSATVGEDIKDITETFLRHPIKILVKKDLLTLQGIKQYYVNVSNDSDKYATVKDLFDNLSIAQAIIYCNSVKRVDELHEAMVEDGFPVEKIHGKLRENERKQTAKDFKRGKCRVLISSDLFARGIDVQQVSIVINFDIPKNVHTYLHRIGRSGRWGRKGLAINLQSKYDLAKLKDIEEYYNTEVIEMPMNYTQHLDL